MDQAQGKSEQELVDEARSGDREAFDVLVKQSAEKIYNLAYRLLGDACQAEDLAQDAFIKAFKNIKNFKHSCVFSSWIYRITINIWKNKVRYEKRRTFLKFFSYDRSIETDEGSIIREIADPQSDPAVCVEDNKEREDIQDILNQLNKKTRELIVLRDIEGLSYEKISELLGFPLGTVKSKLARAREHLREVYIKRKK